MAPSPVIQAPQALLASWDDESTIQTFGVLLKQKFGYNVILWKVPGENPGKALTDSINHALSIHSGSNNPFILYLHGDSLKNSKETLLHPTGTKSPTTVDWVKVRQDCLDNCEVEVFVIFDCKHKALPIRRQRRTTYTITDRDDSWQPKHILQILVAPRDTKQYVASFADVLTGTLRKMVRSSVQSSGSEKITIKSLKAEISSLPNLLYPSEVHDMVDGRNDLQLKVCVSQTGTWNTSNKSKHSSVYVLPITWENIDGWDAGYELKQLIDVFKDHFDFVVEDIVKIPNTIEASDFLDARIEQQIIKAEAEENGLLIVLYNGHAGRDPDDERMHLSSGEKNSVQTVDWTKCTHKLNTAHCDVVHVLDCCYALSATKDGGGMEKSEDMVKAANSRTSKVHFFGRNETLGAGGRYQKVPAGDKASMKLFATVLRGMAEKQRTISIWSWQQHIHTEVGELNKGSRQKYAEPHHKANPICDGQNIQLWVKQRK